MDGGGKDNQITTVTDTWGDAVKAIAQGLADGSENRTGYGSSTTLEKPYATVSGSYVEQKTYNTGCDVAAVIDSENGMVSLRLDNAGEERLAEISKTPDAMDPRKGGSLIKDAGTIGDYLLLVARPTGKATPRYLDKADIDSMLAEKGKGLQFTPNSSRNRRIEVQGTINQVSRYK